MKISIPRQDLLEAVNKVKTVVSPKSALPILSHILIETKDSAIKLSATDLKVSIECTVDCTVREEGALTISSQRLASMLSELPEADVHLSLDSSNSINIECEKIQTKLYSMSPDEFPPIRTFEGVEPIVFAGAMLKNIFQKTSFAICSDQARYNLTGLLLEIKDAVLTTVATDGRRMSLYQETEGIADALDLKVIVPGKMINELTRLIDVDNDVEIMIGESQAGFSFGNIRLVTALIEGTFPNYEMVIPKNHDKEVVLDSSAFTEAIRRTRTMTNDKFNSVRFIITQGLATFRVTTPEVGEYEEELSIDYQGEDREIAFNPDYIVDIMRQIISDKTIIVLKDAMNPAVIKPYSDAPSDKYINVVMPIRI